MLQHPTLYPTLESSVDGAVIPQILGQAVPLAGATHTEDGAFQHPSLVRSFAPLRLGWVQLQNHRLDSLLQIIRYFPYGWQSLPMRWTPNLGHSDAVLKGHGFAFLGGVPDITLSANTRLAVAKYWETGGASTPEPLLSCSPTTCSRTASAGLAKAN